MSDLSQEGIDLVITIIAKAVELHGENEYLKQELRSRRRQGDVWRKKSQELQLKLQFIQMYLGSDKTVDQAIEEVGYKKK